MQVFHQALLGAPSILFLDELDSIVGKRSSRQSGVQERVLSTLLNLMDGIGVKLADRASSEELIEGNSTDTQAQTQVHIQFSFYTLWSYFPVGSSRRNDIKCVGKFARGLTIHGDRTRHPLIRFHTSVRTYIPPVTFHENVFSKSTGLIRKIFGMWHQSNEGVSGCAPIWIRSL